MRTSVVLFVCAGVALVAAPLIAQRSVADAPAPAELPPSSFSSNQYVDSDGCVYIRVGRGEQTSWVPRVNRARQVVCGYRPSLSGGAAQVAAAPAAAQTRPAASTGVIDLTAGMQAPSATTSIASAPRSTSVATAPAVRSVAPTSTVRAPAAPVATTAIAQPRTSPTILGQAANAIASAVFPSARVSNGGGCQWNTINGQTRLVQGRHPVRCGPQAVHPGDSVRGPRNGFGGVGQSGFAGVGSVTAAAPFGYQAVWDDGRLNPNRGPRTAAGDAQMNSIWTQTVPRELVQSATNYGAPIVSYSNPREQTTRLRATSSTRAPSAAAPQQGLITATTAHRFVRAADFASRADAEAAGRRLAAQGLTARIGVVQRGAATSYTILAGPYETSAALAQGLAIARSAGFPSATTR